MKYCASCGKPMEDGDAFCAVCGASAEAVTPAAAPEAAKGRARDLVFAILGLALCGMALSLATMSLRFIDTGMIGRALAINAFILPVPGIVFACLARRLGPRAGLIRLFKSIAFVAAGTAYLCGIAVLVSTL